MKVFTQRIAPFLAPFETPNNCWTALPRGEVPWWDQLFYELYETYQVDRAQNNHEFNYCIVCEPTLYLVGWYWGSESVLEGVNWYSNARRNHPIYKGLGLSSNVITCQDSEHPTNFDLDTLLGSHRLSVPPETKIVGYYRANDPDNFISVP
jgi:hypothetical protein